MSFIIQHKAFKDQHLLQHYVAMKHFVLSTTLLLAMGVSCISSTQAPVPDCSPCWCDKPGNCTDPAVACPPVTNCSAGVVKDRCGCCDVCAKSVGEACRKEPLEKEDEKCARGLACKQSEDSWYCEQLEPENVRVSRCEPDTSYCHDPVTRKYYKTGEIWSRGDFACTACVCQSSGQPRCWGMRCKSPGCKDPAHVEERCCKFCLDSDWDKGCTFHGNKFFHSELIVLQDHRSICKCEQSGGWVCQHDNTQPFIPLNERPECVDPLTDEVYKKGEIWSLSECAHCLCGEYNTGNCSTMQCPAVQCEEPFKIKERCCPVCPQDYSSACHYNGDKYLHGEIIVLPDRCTLCTCDDTSWQCSSDRCKFSKFIQEPLTMRPK